MHDNCMQYIIFGRNRMSREEETKNTHIVLEEVLKETFYFRVFVHS